MGFEVLEGRRLSFGQLARKAGLNPSTIWRWTQRGVGGVKLKAHRLGGRWQVSESDFDAFMKATAERAVNDDKPITAKDKPALAVTKELEARGL